MRCGSCGGYNAEYFTWLGVTSVRCPDCGADLMPGAVLPSGELETYRATGLTPDEIAALKADRDQWQDGTIIVKLADAEAEVDRLCAALKLAQARAADYEADIEAGRLVRLEPCDECRYKLESHAWNYYTYPCNECRQRVKSNFMKPEATRASLDKEDNPMSDATNASHKEYIDASKALDSLGNAYLLTGVALEHDIRAILTGAHKLKKAAALLDVFAHSLRTVRAERDRLRAELDVMEAGTNADRAH